MKKTKLALLLVVALLSVGATVLTSPTRVFASAFENLDNDGVQSSTKAEVVENVEKRFDKLKDTDKVLPVAGGYLYGEADFGVVQGGVKIPLNTFDSVSDAKSITVAQAKEIEIKKIENGSIESATKSNNEAFLPSRVRGASPATQYYELTKNGDVYISESFSGSGWRYAGFWFFNSAWKQGRTRLYWAAFGDSGKVGDTSDVYAHTGVNLYETGQYMAIWPTNGIYLTFYTYNPIPGSGYFVFG